MCAATAADDAVAVAVGVCFVHSLILYEFVYGCTSHKVQCSRLIHNGSCLFDENLYLAKKKDMRWHFGLKTDACIHFIFYGKINRTFKYIPTHTHTYGQDKRTTTEQTNEEEIK